MARSCRVVVDLGAGDGRAVIERARAEPDALVVGIDASAAAMAEVSRRAARPARRGGVPNALFVLAAVEQLPEELVGVADELTIQFPWGSLLRGVLAMDAPAAFGIASLLRPGASMTAFLSITARDGLGIDSLDEPGAIEHLANRWSRHGLCLESACPATVAEIAETGSSWARRLRAGRDRPAWRLAVRHPSHGPDGRDDEVAKAG